MMATAVPTTPTALERLSGAVSPEQSRSERLPFPDTSCDVAVSTNASACFRRPLDCRVVRQRNGLWCLSPGKRSKSRSFVWRSGLVLDRGRSEVRVGLMFR